LIEHLEDQAVVLSLCDLTGNFTQPWVDAGYHAVLVDPQHGMSHVDGRTVKLAGTITDAIEQVRWLIHRADVQFVATFPPCTDLAVSGARWFGKKSADNPLFQAEACAVAEQCRTIGELSGAPFFVENPVSVLSTLWGHPDHIFHPWHFTGHEAGDNYTKKTCLWTGGGFGMPRPKVDTTLGEPDDRIHKAPPGDDRANFRSATPMGFARAVFEANVKAVA